MSNKTTGAALCLIGDIVVDVTLKTVDTPLKLRLGGIVHAARALWAMNITYDIAYFAPAYLDNEIHQYLTHHGCGAVIKLGNITGAPNVFLIGEAKEIGDQGYEFLLRDHIVYETYQEGIDRLVAASYKDHMLISGNYNLGEIVNQLAGAVHIDAANNLKDITFLNQFTRKIDTLFLSTSSDIFHNYYKDDFFVFAQLFGHSTGCVILKENRGGSRGYDFTSSKFFTASSQPRKVAHSVGVGDAFDATYVSNKSTDTLEQRLTLASWIAAEYASTSFPDDLKQNIGRVLKTNIETMVAMQGISLPWEKRKGINVYIAAPDFSFVDTRIIDQVSSALLYHNFSPRRPIRENGEMEESATKIRKQELVGKDLAMLDECLIVLVILLYNDPGTLIELGYAVAKGMKVLVYDPHNKASNCMLTELPHMVSSDMDEIITEIFSMAANHVNSIK